MAGFSPIAVPGVAGRYTEKEKRRGRTKSYAKIFSGGSTGDVFEEHGKKTITNKNSSGSGNKSGSSDGRRESGRQKPCGVWSVFTCCWCS